MMERIHRPRFHNRIGRVGAVAVALFALLALVAGCSSSSSEPKNDAPLPPVQDLLAASSQAAKTMRDVRVELAVDGTIDKLPVKRVSAYLTNDPETAGQGDADINYNGLSVQAKFVVTGGDLWAQLAPGQAYQNMRRAADVYDASAILDPNKGIANLVVSVRDPKAEGREQIGGTDTVRISGIIPSSALAGIVPNTNLGDRPVTLWVQEAAPNNLVRANVGFDAGTLSVTLSNWGAKEQLIDPRTAR